jgi:hypothetical protein
LERCTSAIALAERLGRLLEPVGGGRSLAERGEDPRGRDLVPEPRPDRRRAAGVGVDRGDLGAGAVEVPPEGEPGLGRAGDRDGVRPVGGDGLDVAGERPLHVPGHEGHVAQVDEGAEHRGGGVRRDLEPGAPGLDLAALEQDAAGDRVDQRRARGPDREQPLLGGLPVARRRGRRPAGGRRPLAGDVVGHERREELLRLRVLVIRREEGGDLRRQRRDRHVPGATPAGRVEQLERLRERGARVARDPGAGAVAGVERVGGRLPVADDPEDAPADEQDREDRDAHDRRLVPAPALRLLGLDDLLRLLAELVLVLLGRLVRLDPGDHQRPRSGPARLVGGVGVARGGAPLLVGPAGEVVEGRALLRRRRADGRRRRGRGLPRGRGGRTGRRRERPSLGARHLLHRLELLGGDELLVLLQLDGRLRRGRRGSLLCRRRRGLGGLMLLGDRAVGLGALLGVVDRCGRGGRGGDGGGRGRGGGRRRLRGGLAVPPHRVVQQPLHAVVGRLQLDRTGEDGDRLLVLRALQQRLAGEVERVGIGGLDRDGDLELVHRLLGAAQLEERAPPGDAAEDRVRVVLEPAGADLDGAVGAPLLEERARELDEDPRLRIRLEDQLVLLDDRGHAASRI